MCHFLKPMQELRPKRRYSADIRHSSCFWDVQTVKNRMRDRRYRRKLPSAAKIVFVISRQIRHT